MTCCQKVDNLVTNGVVKALVVHDTAVVEEVPVSEKKG